MSHHFSSRQREAVNAYDFLIPGPLKAMSEVNDRSGPKRQRAQNLHPMAANISSNFEYLAQASSTSLLVSCF